MCVSFGKRFLVVAFFSLSRVFALVFGIVAAGGLIHARCTTAQAEPPNHDVEQDWQAVPNPVFRGGQWGYVDNQGEVVIEPQFALAWDFFENRAAVYTANRSGYIQSDGEWAVVLPQDAFSAREFSEGRAWFRQNGKYGCVDSDGNIIIPAKYDWVEEFSAGLAVVTTGRRADFGTEAPYTERWGFVNRSGRVAIPLEYVDAGSFGNGLARVRRPGQRHWEYIDCRGTVVFSLGQLVLEPGEHVGAAWDFANGRLRVSIDGSGPGVPYNLALDTMGRPIRGGFKYRLVGSFSEGLARVKVGDKFGYVDTSGRLVIAPRFDEASSFQENLAAVRIGDAWGYIDRRGTVVAKGGSGKEAKWNDAEGFHGGLARVHIGGEFQHTMDGPVWWEGGAWYYIDRCGTIVALCRRDSTRFQRPGFGKELPAPVP
ncbi:MAG: WG repeat-containing protein [Planctomycetes bacterium]|nr:WG repeat-containing protein [Planctomycetota bacterium]MBL7037808.1 WG repeat-containing protein [Pirellulaceae bacterium]